jgi:outer membrane lipoprotein SlyB
MTSASRPARLAAAALVATALAGCATTSATAPYSGGGTVVAIREVSEPSMLATLGGAIGGAAIGGALGANVGGGSGQIAAAAVLSAVTGTIGAAAAGWFGTRTRYEVTVRSDDGIDRSFKLDELPTFRSGAKVRVDGGKLVADR